MKPDTDITGDIVHVMRKLHDTFYSPLTSTTANTVWITIDNIVCNATTGEVSNPVAKDIWKSSEKW
jgi:hypothetical protein